jgi:fatty-acyl-CoA synthase
VTGDELAEWVCDRVPERAAAPKHVEIVDEIPLTSVGKQYKPELRRRAAEEAARAAVPDLAPRDDVRAVLVDGAIEIHVPHSIHDDAVCEALSRYPWTWKLTN